MLIHACTYAPGAWLCSSVASVKRHTTRAAIWTGSTNAWHHKPCNRTVRRERALWPPSKAHGSGYSIASGREAPCHALAKEGHGGLIRGSTDLRGEPPRIHPEARHGKHPATCLRLCISIDFCGAMLLAPRAQSPSGAPRQPVEPHSVSSAVFSEPVFLCSMSA